MYGLNSVQEFLNIPVEKLYFDEKDRVNVIDDIIKNKRVKGKILRLRRFTEENFWGLLSATCH